MCGIIGYTGKRNAAKIIFQGLKRLEYRGYDSCGLALVEKGKIILNKQAGPIAKLEPFIAGQKVFFSTGIGHTRWATHGLANRINAHPHFDCQKKIALAHNGIIENYLTLKKELIKKGHSFRSQTDSEVVAHLVEEFFRQTKDLEGAFQKAITKLQGSFAFVLISVYAPGKIFIARKDSPLIVGLGEEENFVASDIPAFLPFTHRVVYLEEGESGVIDAKKIRFFGRRRRLRSETVSFRSIDAVKGRWRHFMLKEIYEQPEVIERISSFYVKGKKIHFPQLGISQSFLKKVKKIYIVACGTAYHAGLAAKYLKEGLSQIPLEVEVSSEFRYRQIKFSSHDLVISISQSGETADTLAAVRLAKVSGVKTITICNVMGSSLVRESDGFINTLAGPEVGVASTKAYTAQLACLFLFFLYFSSLRQETVSVQRQKFIKEFQQIPRLQREFLRLNFIKIKRLAKAFSKYGCFLFLGRGINYPLALEGALKLKEISYIPAEGYPAGEMKHGPIALIDEYKGVVCIITQGRLYEKMFSNLEEIKSRQGKILALATQGDRTIKNLTPAVIFLPSLQEYLSIFFSAIALQLFAYFVAYNLGRSIDKPRNLAKSVTVE